MTWEQFEQTGAVEDYLSYKGAQEETWPGRRMRERWPGGPKARKETAYGADDYGDRHGPEGISLR